MADHPLRPTRDRWLGKLLSPQLPNPDVAPPFAIFLSTFKRFYSPFYREQKDRFNIITHPYAILHANIKIINIKIE